MVAFSVDPLPSRHTLKPDIRLRLALAVSEAAKTARQRMIGRQRAIAIEFIVLRLIAHGIASTVCRRR